MWAVSEEILSIGACSGKGDGGMGPAEVGNFLFAAADLIVETGIEEVVENPPEFRSRLISE